MNPVFQRLILISSCLWLAACSSALNQPLLDANVAVPKDKAIVVMGFDFIEIKDNEDTEKKTSFSSASLIKDKLQVKDKLETFSNRKLADPLYHLASFDLLFAQKDQTLVIQRMGNDILGYESLALHSFEPGQTRLKGIDFRVQLYKPIMEPGQSIQLTQWLSRSIKAQLGTWDIPQGKVVYLGHLTLYFQSKTGITGLLLKRESLYQTRLIKAEIVDRFKETQEQLTQTKPWFPAQAMLNLAEPKLLQLEKPFDEPKKEPKKAHKQRDSSKYFY